MRSTIVVLLLAFTLGGIVTAAPPVPLQLTDEAFWKLSSASSEIDGLFRSDNLLSNETNFQYVIPGLLEVAKPGRVYMGVGPEQNFTYIAALKPSMAFIVDIRHGNLDLHLMYKALFEMSANRAEFMSKLFSRKQPAALTAESTANQLFSAYLRSEPSEELFNTTLRDVISHLKTKHKFPLTDGDLEGIEWALSNYYKFGPNIFYNSSDLQTAPAIVGVEDTFAGRRGGGMNYVTYATLMTADDGSGLNRSYLSNEENFNVLKNLESKNLLVPVVGDFGGPKAIREVGKYLKSIDAMVSAFYLSNVEQYLSQQGKQSAFLANVASLPIDETSRFIRSGGGGFGGGGGMSDSRLGFMFEESRQYKDR